MEKNELIAGRPRIGWVFDGSPDVAPIAAMLVDTAEGITLTVPLISPTPLETQNRNSVHGPWFAYSGVILNDIPTTEGKCPKTLQFHDAIGSVLLVGCRSVGTLPTMLSNQIGHGKIIADYAVFGGHSFEYDRINGMRSAIDGLFQWFGRSSMALEHLGFHMAKLEKTGAHLNSRNQLKSFKAGLELIQTQLPPMLLPDWKQWIDEAIDCYLGTKHPDHPLPDYTVRANVWRQNVLVLRAWIAKYLGVDDENLLDRLQHDPLNQPYTVED
ncbi:MAG: hypothetical protein LBC29_00270 [Propionibacteriaceae bacterium]|jgi:hypothetical protein|nr:hypothetical protein [Propionibacteriaceae bacterium]